MKRLTHYRQYLTALCKIAAFFMLLLPFLAQAQMNLDPQKSLSQFGVDFWTADKGLPSVAVNKVLQSRNNYIWLGTYDGLLRFDGATFMLYNSGNVNSFTINDVITMHEDRKGSLWIGTNGGGLLKYSDNHFRKNGGSAYQNETIYCIFEDHDGTIWAGAKNGIIKVGKGKVGYHKIPNFDKVIATAIYQDRENNMWFGTQKNGIIFVQDSTQEVINFGVADKLVDERVTAIYQDRNSRIWVGTEAGLFQYQQKDSTFSSFDFNGKLPPNTRINTIYEDMQGSLWIGTTDGLCRYHKNNINVLTVVEGLPDNDIRSITADQEGCLWIGTYRAGLMRIKDGKFTSFTSNEGLVHEAVNSIIEDSKNNLWLATDRGVSKYDNISFSNIVEGLPNAKVRDVIEDKQGRLWFATYGGLVLYNNGKMTIWNKQKGLSDDQARRLFIDSRNRMWIGTKAGIDLMTEEGKFEHFNTNDGLSSDYIMSINESPTRGIMIGTNGGGLNFLKDREDIKIVGTKQGLAGEVVYTAYEDTAKILWVGTNGGLTRIERNNFSQITEQDGLLSDKIFQIVEDSSGYMWMSCNKGVFKVLKKELNQVSIGKIRKVNSITYTKYDGLLTNEIPANGKVCKLKDGRIAIPTLKGFSLINPNNIRMNRIRPPVYVEEVYLDGKLAHNEDGDEDEEILIIPQHVKRIDIRYAALSLFASEKVQFQYRLEPYDNKWIEVGSDRVAHFTNLPPGDYTFRVIASNNDGVWNKKGAVFKFKVKAYIYQQAWFYYLLMVLGGLGIWYYNKGLRKEREEAEKEEKALSEGW
jgi:ligand-binding sensor domain-containing protein